MFSVCVCETESSMEVGQGPNWGAVAPKKKKRYEPGIKSTIYTVW
jgi:hypothetical protein